jgi:hypothetical protein
MPQISHIFISLSFTLHIQLTIFTTKQYGLLKKARHLSQPQRTAPAAKFDPKLQPSAVKKNGKSVLL